MRGRPRKLQILELASEKVGNKPAGMITSWHLRKYMGIPITRADFCLEYYTKRGWLEFVEWGRIGHERGHPIKIYRLTPEGERELRRMRQRYG